MVISEKKKKRIKLLLQSAYLHSNNLPFTYTAKSCNHALTLVLCVIYTGGLGFSTDQIGTALLCVAGPMLVLQFWVYPKVNQLRPWLLD